MKLHLSMDELHQYFLKLRWTTLENIHSVFPYLKFCDLNEKYMKSFYIPISANKSVR